MREKLSLRLLLLGAAVAFAGCAARQDARMREATASLSRAAGQPVEWLGKSASQADATQTVRDLLRQPLAVEDAVRVALLNNRNLQANLEEIGIAHADLLQAGLPSNPELEASVRTPTDSTVEGDPLSPRISTIDIDATQDVMSLLLAAMRRRAAAANVRKTEQMAAQAVIDLGAEVRSAWYELQGARQMLEMRRTILQATEASLDAATRVHRAGNIPDLELSNEQTLHGQARLDLAQAEADEVQAQEHLRALLGLWGPDVQLTLAGSLQEPPANEVPAEGLESLAVARHPGLAAAGLEIERLARGLGVTNASRWVPSLHLGVHVERESEGEWTVGPSLAVALPLFDRGQAQVSRGQAELRQAQQRYVALAVEVRSAVRAAWSGLAAARAKADYLRKAVLPLRHRIVEQTQLEYNAMQVGVFPLLQAKQAEIDAGREYVEALQQYWLRRVELERAAGGRLQQTSGPEGTNHDHTP